MTPDTSHEASRILIAGAGIGGLTAALTLHAKGFDVGILEKSRTLEPLGVGINLLPHAVRELSALGLGVQLSSIAVAPTSICFYESTGDLLFREPRGLAAGDPFPQLSVHRGRLQMLLLTAVRERIGPDAVRTSADVHRIAQTASGVRVRTGSGVERGSVLVGADGIGSAVRAALHPGPDPLLSAGVTMFRGVTRTTPFLDGATMAIVKGQGGIDLIAYPISDTIVNWVLQVPDGTAGPLAGQANWNAPTAAHEVVPHVAAWQLDWLDAAHLVGGADQILRYPMVDKDVLPHWGAGRITLLGDAAHPMYPVGANGASQAIVDARVLADALSEHGVAGLRSYEQARRTETADVIAANRAMHRASSARSPQALRNVTTTYRIDTARSNRS